MERLEDSPVVVYSAANRAQAYLLLDWLHEQGIEAQVVNDALEAAGGDLPLGWVSAPKLVVPGSQAEKVKPLLAQFESRSLAARNEPDPIGAPSDFDWPHCPRCGELRPTLCPHCGLSGTEFPQAWIGRDSDDDLLVVCPTCDEPFRPQFYNTCHRCNHDYGEGLPTPKATGGQPIEHESPITWFALAGVVAAIGGLLAYFVWLFRG